MGKTLTLRDALVTDLNQITTGNGYAMTLVEVSREPKPPEELGTPGVAITGGRGGVSDAETLGNRDGLALQEFQLDLVVNEDNGDQALDNLLDAVRDAIERTGGAMLTSPRVEMVTVTEWTESRTERGIHHNLHVRSATVEARYLYTRGDL